MVMGLIGRKVGMTRILADDGRVLPDTVYLDSFDLNKLFLCLTESGGNRDDN